VGYRSFQGCLRWPPDEKNTSRFRNHRWQTDSMYFAARCLACSVRHEFADSEGGRNRSVTVGSRKEGGLFAARFAKRG
jgi:hypothetical protein